MMRLFLAVAVLAIICAIDPSRFATFEHVAAQAPAQSIGNEPHHKRLLYTNDLRLWDVTVPPGQSTSPYVHEYDVATVVIGEGTLNIQRNGEQVSAPSPNARGSVIISEHTGAPATYRIENNGTTEYRALEVENMHEGNWPSVSPIGAPGSSVLKESRAFTIYDVMLKQGAEPAMHQHTGATIIVVLGGTLEQGGIGGEEPVRIQQPGQWLVLPRLQAHTLASATAGGAHAIEIEAK